MSASADMLPTTSFKVQVSPRQGRVDSQDYMISGFRWGIPEISETTFQCSKANIVVQQGTVEEYS